MFLDVGVKHGHVRNMVWMRRVMIVLMTSITF